MLYFFGHHRLIKNIKTVKFVVCNTYWCICSSLKLLTSHIHRTNLQFIEFQNALIARFKGISTINTISVRGSLSHAPWITSRQIDWQTLTPTLQKDPFRRLQHQLQHAPYIVIENFTIPTSLNLQNKNNCSTEKGSVTDRDYLIFDRASPLTRPLNVPWQRR